MDQNYTPQQTSQISVADIIKMFHGKMKTMICFALIVAIIAAAGCAAFSLFDSQYGATIEFYLEPGANTQTLIKLLKSEAFAEEMLLDEYGLPNDINTEDEELKKLYDEALAAVKKEREIRERHIVLFDALDRFDSAYDPDAEEEYKQKSLSQIESEYEIYVEEYKDIEKLLSMYKGVYVVTESNTHNEMVKTYEQRLAEAMLIRDSYKLNVYNKKMNEKIRLEAEYNKTAAELKDARDDADAALEKVRDKWRNDDEVKKGVALIQNSVSYEYASVVDEKNNITSSDVSDVKENTNFSFLEITVTVDGSLENADEIVQGIKNNAPNFIIRNLEKITDSAEAKCTLISTFASAHKLGGMSTTTLALTGAGIGALAAIVLYSLAIIVKGCLPEDTFPKKEKKNKKSKKTDEAA